MKQPFPCPSGVMPGILVLRRGAQTLFWPHEFVAMLRDEGTGRLEATAADGQVAHAVGSVAEHGGPPWFQVAEGTWVHPAHAQRDGATLALPGGWRIPFAGPLPAPTPVEPEPFMPGTKVRRGDVWGLAYQHKQAVWLTDAGEIPCGCTQAQAGRLHGDLTRVGKALVNRRRVRALGWDPADDQTHVRLDTGQVFRVAGRASLPALRTSLGLAAHPDEETLSLFHQGLFLYGLRDFPSALFEAPTEALRTWFPDNTPHLIANLLWQTVRLRCAGQATDYGTTTRGFWYRPLLPVLTRAGHAEGRSPVALYRFYQKVALTLVGEYRLFRYADLGFGDQRPDLRGVGTLLPHVVILCEKLSLTGYARRLAEQFGVSFQTFHGQPRLQGTEALVRALQGRVSQPLQVVAYVDYDYAGWIIADAFAAQLQRYGMAVGSVAHMVTPDRFTDAELRALSHPIHATGGEVSKLRAWVAKGGGIQGRARGIYANHLQPYERVAQAFAAVQKVPAPS